MGLISDITTTTPVTFRVMTGVMKTIGRAPTADFTLDCTLVSRLHCRLISTNDRLEVEDLDSTNGTFVNGQQVKRKVLTSGDTLLIGQIELTVSEESAS
ncbi:MAG: FHA domain-containing protein [Acidobacteriota bacterium]|nr:FHA domain-containing protein [Acidobacteriota bacterium]MEE3138093.1 FHA domain-containing protein [Acidobacteriota bacterium]